RLICRGILLRLVTRPFVARVDGFCRFGARAERSGGGEGETQTQRLVDPAVHGAAAFNRTALGPFPKSSSTADLFAGPRPPRTSRAIRADRGSARSASPPRPGRAGRRGRSPAGGGCLCRAVGTLCRSASRQECASSLSRPAWAHRSARRARLG